MSPLFLLFAGAVSLCGVRPEQTQVRVGLYADFEHPAPTLVRQAVREELAAILIPTGAILSWTSLADDQPDQWWTKVASIQFKGHCDASDLWMSPRHLIVLGTTSVVRGEVSPYGAVDCDSIRALLAPTLIPMTPESRVVLYGRAIGRVLAHELYHILTRTQVHGSNGLGDATFTRRNLAASEFRFHDREIRRLRMALGPRPAESAPGTPSFECRGQE